jgi:hypothetical protein
MGIPRSRHRPRATDFKIRSRDEPALVWRRDRQPMAWKRIRVFLSLYIGSIVCMVETGSDLGGFNRFGRFLQGQKKGLKRRMIGGYRKV